MTSAGARVVAGWEYITHRRSLEAHLPDERLPVCGVVGHVWPRHPDGGGGGVGAREGEAGAHVVPPARAAGGLEAGLQEQRRAARAQDVWRITRAAARVDQAGGNRGG